MQLIDSHCHIPLLSDHFSVDTILSNAKDNAVGHMLCVAIDLAGVPEIIALTKQYPVFSASAGVHPNQQLQNEVTVDDIVASASADAVVAIGETGLDYLKTDDDLTIQRQRFRNHISAAKTLNKPLIIHMRNAKQDVINILKEEQADKVGGVMHCFTEDLATAEQAIAMNFLISFSGIVTFKNAKQQQAVAAELPLEHMLIETDSPYLAPTPLRGQVNQPANVRYVAEFIADLKAIELAEVAAQTTKNYNNLFNKIK